MQKVYGTLQKLY